MGTFIGGILGFAVYEIGRHFWDEVSDGVFLSLIAAGMAYCSVIVGKHLSLDLSAKLFCTAFLLVCMHFCWQVCRRFYVP